MRRMRLGMSVSVLALTLAAGGYLGVGTASAQGRGPGGPGGRFGRGPGGPMEAAGLPPMLLERLNLSDSQRDQLKQIMTADRTANQALHERGMAAHEAFEQAVTTIPVDEATIRARAADVAAVDADLAVARAHSYDQVFQLLTPDQQTQLTKLQADMQARAEAMRSRRAANQSKSTPSK